MSRALVWDLPTRIFHWLLTVTILAASVIALAVDDEAALFQLHMILGLIAGFMVILRVVWGVVGSRYARFSSFLFGPKALIEYLLDVSRRTGERHIGHNPGSAYAIYGMLLLTLGLALSGLMMSSWEPLEELHEPMAHGLLLIVIAHVAGILLHTIRHRENIAMSMVTGWKRADPDQGIGSAHAVVGLLFLVLTVGWSALLFNGLDARVGQLSLFGQTFQLGESEREGLGERDHERRRRDHEEHHRRDD